MDGFQPSLSCPIYRMGRRLPSVPLAAEGKVNGHHQSVQKVPPSPRHVSPGRNLETAWKVTRSHLCPVVGTGWKIQGLGEDLGGCWPNSRWENDFQGSKQFPSLSLTPDGSQHLPPRPVWLLGPAPLPAAPRTWTNP